MREFQERTIYTPADNNGTYGGCIRKNTLNGEDCNIGFDALYDYRNVYTHASFEGTEKPSNISENDISIINLLINDDSIHEYVVE